MELESTTQTDEEIALPAVVEQPHIIFTSHPKILSSVLQQKKLSFGLSWKVWRHRIITITNEGMLQYTNKRDKISDKLDITTSMITYIPDDVLLTILASNELNKFVGITIKCRTHKGFDTYARLICDLEQFEALKSALTLAASVSTNIDTLGPIPTFTPEQVRGQRLHKQHWLTKSVMRRTISQAMSSYDAKTRHKQIREKRGALTFLPALFLNDLIHGSW